LTTMASPVTLLHRVSDYDKLLDLTTDAIKAKEAKLVNLYCDTSLTIQGDDGTSSKTTILLKGTTANSAGDYLLEIQDDASASLFRIQEDGTGYLSGSMTINGDLTVDGLTTTINTTQLDVEDQIIRVVKSQTGSPGLDGGISVERGSSNNTVCVFDESVDEWVFGYTTDDTASQLMFASLADIRANEGNLEGGLILTNTGITMTGLDLASSGNRAGTLYCDTVDATTITGTIVSTGTDNLSWTINQDADSSTDEDATLKLMSGDGTNAPLTATLAYINVDGTISNSYLTSDRSVNPSVNDSYSLGTTSLRWSDFNAVSGSFSGTGSAGSDLLSASGNVGDVDDFSVLSVDVSRSAALTGEKAILAMSVDLAGHATDSANATLVGMSIYTDGVGSADHIGIELDGSFEYSITATDQDAVDTAGNVLSLFGSTGGDASAVAGGAGGDVTLTGGDGGAGTPLLPGGSGGNIEIDAGVAGTDNGNGTGSNGQINLGASTTSAITLQAATTASAGLTLTTTGLTMTGLDLASSGNRAGTLYCDTLDATTIVGDMTSDGTNSLTWTVNEDADSATNEDSALILKSGDGTNAPLSATLTYINPDGTTGKSYLQSNRHLRFTTDNTLDLGAAGALRPRTIYLGTSLVAGSSSPTTYNDTSISVDSSKAFSVSAGTDLSLVAGSGDVTAKLGDTAGAEYFRITDSADALRFAINSDGEVANDIVPETDSTHQLGSTSKFWANVRTDAIGHSSQDINVKSPTLAFNSTGKVSAAGTLTLDSTTNSGIIVTDDGRFDKKGTADVGTQGYDSYANRFRGSGWTGSAAVNVDYRMRTEVTDSTDYKFVISNQFNGGGYSEIFNFDVNDAANFTGNLNANAGLDVVGNFTHASGGTGNIDVAWDFSGGVTNSAAEFLVSGGNLQLNDNIHLEFGTANEWAVNYDGSDLLLEGAQPAAAGTTGPGWIVTAADGSNGSGATPGAYGGAFTWTAGAGGDGTATASSGDGGSIIISAGESGVDNGGGSGSDGTLALKAGGETLIDLTGEDFNVILGYAAAGDLLVQSNRVALNNAAANADTEDVGLEFVMGRGAGATDTQVMRWITDANHVGSAGSYQAAMKLDYSSDSGSSFSSLVTMRYGVAQDSDAAIILSPDMGNYTSVVGVYASPSRSAGMSTTGDSQVVVAAAPRKHADDVSGSLLASFGATAPQDSGSGSASTLGYYVSASDGYDLGYYAGDDTIFAFGAITADDANLQWVSASNDWLFDNIHATGSTLMRLGTDTSATDFQIQNDSASALLTVDGSGQATFSGNVDADAGLDVSGAALTTSAGLTLTTSGITMTGLDVASSGNRAGTVYADTGDFTDLDVTNLQTPLSYRKLTNNSGVTIPQYAAVYISGDGEVSLCDASVTATSEFYGVALEQILNAASGKVAFDAGNVSAKKAAGEGWTAGDPIYLSEIAGEFTQVAPATSGAFVKQVGIAVTTQSAGNDGDMLIQVYDKVENA